jgi:hypothetical protein
MRFLLLGFVFITIIMVVSFYIYKTTSIREHYLESTSFEEIIKPIAISLYQKSLLVTNPLVDTTNKIIDVFNEVPQKIWENGVASSASIRSKLKQYAEGMTSYNRTPDDNESLKMVTINRRHKVFIDDMKERNKRQYELLTNVSEAFYSTKFEEQDDMLYENLTKLVQVFPQIETQLTKK